MQRQIAQSSRVLSFPVCERWWKTTDIKHQSQRHEDKQTPLFRTSGLEMVVQEASLDLWHSLDFPLPLPYRYVTLSRVWHTDYPLSSFLMVWQTDKRGWKSAEQFYYELEVVIRTKLLRLDDKKNYNPLTYQKERGEWLRFSGERKRGPKCHNVDRLECFSEFSCISCVTFLVRQEPFVSLYAILPH